jgi:hypothetical protein
MKNFKDYVSNSDWPNKPFVTEETLEEAKKPSQAATSGISADDKGKMHELLLSKYLHPEERLPDHHRSESENEDHAGTPVQVYDRLKKKIGDAAYNEIDTHARATAAELKKHLDKTGQTGKDVKIGNVHWTSNRDTEKSKGDHEKTTGVKDVNSNADLILSLHDKKGNIVGYHGVSAKYGSEKEPNYKNPGMATLENMSGMASGRIGELLQPHKDAMEKIGYNGTIEERHAKYKIDSMGIDKARAEKKRLDTLVNTGRKLSLKERTLHSHLSSFVHAHDTSTDKAAFLAQSSARAKMAECSAQSNRANIAKEISKALDEKSNTSKGGSDKYLGELIRNHVSPKTVIPHTIAHSWVQDDGSSMPKVKPADDIANDHLNKFEGLHVAMDKAGGSVTIKGYHKETKKLTNVATYGLKSQSGPHKGLNATLKLQ